MPIEYKIDHERRIVLARGRGTLTVQDLFAYQHEVWSHSELAGYSELMDMSAVEHIARPSSERIQTLASLSAQMDAPETVSKFAIVAPGDQAFGLGRMYEIYRELDELSTKQVAVFRTMAAALEWLTTDEPEKGTA